MTLSPCAARLAKSRAIPPPANQGPLPERQVSFSTPRTRAPPAFHPDVCSHPPELVYVAEAVVEHCFHNQARAVCNGKESCQLLHCRSVGKTRIRKGMDKERFGF